MLTTAIQKFTKRLLPLAVAAGMGGTALAAYFAPNLVDYFVSSSGSTATEFDPGPIVSWPVWP